MHGASAFVPDPLSRELPLEGSTIRLLCRANHALGELSGVARPLKNPYLLGSALLRREAILSSRIEGTITSPEQLVLFEAGARFEEGHERNDTREVLNYVHAMQRGLSLLKNLPVSLRLIRELHEVLLQGVRGEQEHPGKFRDSQNWIGRRGSSIHEATYVPPPVKEMGEALDDLEKYIHVEPHGDQGGLHDFDEDPNIVPVLIRLALIHYQFEAIHPFRDGNGRVGRLLIPLLLVSHGRLRSPLLYLSAYFERHRADYNDLMLSVSQNGKWTEWIDFFLRGVAESANESISQADRLIALRERWRAVFETARSSALLHKLIDRLFETPAITIGDARDLLDVSMAAASSNVKKLVEAGIVKERTGNKRRQVFVAMDIVSLIDDSNSAT
ncbi:MAG: Fic family protein [Deltaproteobacteria bacterium]|nr:Fic family protein [Deltaproteobacteria bacterium]